VKDVLLRPSALQAYPTDRAALMPDRRVAVGESWRPAPAALDAWAEGQRLAGGAAWTVREAQFTLTAVRDGVAEVRGKMKLEARVRDRTVRAVARPRWLIDTRSGVWLDESSQVEARTRVEGFGRVHRISANKSVRFERGDGKSPKALPDGYYDIGWASPGADTNRYRNTSAGFSLDVPEPFEPVEADAPVAVDFRAPDGAHLQVRQHSAPRPVEPDARLGEMADRLAGAYADFKLGDTESLMLAGGVPAAMLTGTFRRDGDARVLAAMVAVDGRRVVAVTAAGADTLDNRRRLTRIVRTLRLLGPAPGAAPSQER
ncbi:MAG: hypothetical protein ACOC8F_04610, partial [Planctomycetota bacterium]